MYLFTCNVPCCRVCDIVIYLLLEIMTYGQRMCNTHVYSCMWSDQIFHYFKYEIRQIIDRTTTVLLVPDETHKTIHGNFVYFASRVQIAFCFVGTHTHTEHRTSCMVREREIERERKRTPYAHLNLYMCTMRYRTFYYYIYSTYMYSRDDGDTYTPAGLVFHGFKLMPFFCVTQWRLLCFAHCAPLYRQFGSCRYLPDSFALTAKMVHTRSISVVLIVSATLTPHPLSFARGVHTQTHEQSQAATYKDAHTAAQSHGKIYMAGPKTATDLGVRTNLCRNSNIRETHRV